MENKEKVTISRYSDLQYTEEEQKIVDAWESSRKATIISPLQKALKEDKEYYDSWQSSIAIAFTSAAMASDPMPYCNERYNWLHESANIAARNFLDNLIK